MKNFMAFLTAARRRRSLLAALMLAALVLAPAARAGQQIDADPAVDFTSYASFAWATRPAEAPDPGRRKPTLDQVFTDAVADTLRQRGLAPASEESADLLLVHYVDARHRLADFSVGYRPQPGGWLRPLKPVPEEKSAVTLDLIDSARGVLVWRGTLSLKIGKPETLPRRIRSAVASLLRRWPPHP